MLNNFRGISPSSEAMSDDTIDRNHGEKALITKTPPRALVFTNKTMTGAKNYSDKNGNDVTKVSKGRKTFAFWALVCLLFMLAIGNLILTFTILAVLRLGQGMESMEFLPEHNAIKMFGDIDLEHVYKRDGVIEGFRDTPMTIESENGAVHFNLQTRLSRSDTKLTVNASGVFARGVSSLSLAHPATGAPVFSTAAASVEMPEPVNNINAKQVSVCAVRSAWSSDLSLRGEGAALRGAEGARLDARTVTLTADQDVRLTSVNGSIVMSGKEGVYVDVRYLPIALQLNKTTSSSYTGQYKVCVCMPQGKLFRIHASSSEVTCASVNLTGEHNPCA